jgi:hypothetical protein
MHASEGSHPGAPALAGIASRVPDGTVTRQVRRSRRRATRATRRRVMVGALVTLPCFVLFVLAGGAARTAGGAVPGRNQVSAHGSARDLGPRDSLPLASPVVGLAATPRGEGYWLVASDGGVFAFGDAVFHGSVAELALAAPVVGIAATPTGEGYWLVASDGGVFAFGDAAYDGSPHDYGVDEATVGLAPSADGDGYYVVGRSGGVFAFGGAAYRGAASALFAPRVVGIAADPDGSGYWVARVDGTVAAIDAVDPADVDDVAAPVVAIAADPGGAGYWLAHGDELAPPVVSLSDHPFLVCTRAIESDSSGGYAAVSASGTYRGAYQFSRSTWDSTARHAGRPDLVGVDPAAASPADQDALALHLYQWQGASPWGGRCAGL